MNVQLTISEIYYNGHLSDFLMRAQAYNTLDELINKNGDEDSVLSRIDEYADECGYTFDEIEEMLYSDSVEEIAETVGIELR